jgi:hypothetical protein
MNPFNGGLDKFVVFLFSNLSVVDYYILFILGILVFLFVFSWYQRDLEKISLLQQIRDELKKAQTGTRG